MAESDQADRTMMGQRIIIGAMITGVVMFTVIALAIGPLSFDESLRNTLGLVLVLLGTGEVIAFTIVRTAILGKLSRDLANDPPGADPTTRVVPAVNTITLIGAAMAEGWGLFGTVILLLSGNMLFLIAPLLAVVIMLLILPSRPKLEALTARLTGRNPFAG